MSSRAEARTERQVLGFLMAGADGWTKLSNSLSLSLPASRLGIRWEALAPLAEVELRIPEAPLASSFVETKQFSAP